MIAESCSGNDVATIIFWAALLSIFGAAVCFLIGAGLVRYAPIKAPRKEEVE